MSSIAEKIPKKYQDIVSMAFFFTVCVFCFGDGKDHPVLTMIGAIGGTWFGYAFSSYAMKTPALNSKSASVLATILLLGTIGFTLWKPDPFAPIVEPESKTQARSAKIAETFETNMHMRLPSEGFTQHETDLTVKEVMADFNKFEESFKVLVAAERAADSLGLDEKRKTRLNLAVLRAFAQSSEITFDAWSQCLNHRVKTMPSCVQDIAQDLARSIAAVTPDQVFASEDSLKRENLAKLAMGDAAEQCGITADEADRALRLVLSDCP